MACYIILYSYQAIQDLILLLTALLFLFLFLEGVGAVVMI